MNFKRVAAAVTAGVGLLCAGFWFGSASANTPEPGSAGDPLVSKSYVDKVVAALADKGYVDQKTAAMADKAYVDNRTTFTVVNVPAGARLIGEGGTEVVLRGGKATTIAGPLGGLLNVTDGTDMLQGQAVKPNQLLVVPRSDGRGLLAQTEVIAMVRGAYTVKPAGQP